MPTLRLMGKKFYYVTVAIFLVLFFLDVPISVPNMMAVERGPLFLWDLFWASSRILFTFSILLIVLVKRDYLTKKREYEVDEWGRAREINGTPSALEAALEKS